MRPVDGLECDTSVSTGEIRLLKSDQSVAFGFLMIDQPVATESRYPPSIVLKNDSYGGAIWLHDAFWRGNP